MVPSAHTNPTQRNPPPPYTTLGLNESKKDLMTTSSTGKDNGKGHSSDAYTTATYAYCTAYNTSILWHTCTYNPHLVQFIQYYCTKSNINTQVTAYTGTYGLLYRMHLYRYCTDYCTNSAHLYRMQRMYYHTKSTPLYR